MKFGLNGRNVDIEFTQLWVVRTAPNGSVKVASVLTDCVNVAGTAECT